MPYVRRALWLTLTLVLVAPSASNAAPYFRDFGRYAAPEGDSEITVTTPSSTSIRFAGHALGIYAYSGTSSRGAFVLDEPTRVSITGTVSVLETGGPPSGFDFRISHFEDEFLAIFWTTGIYDLADEITLSPGDYSFFIGANGTDASDGASFDVLLTIPEPSTANSLVMGLCILASLQPRRRSHTTGGRSSNQPRRTS